MLRSFILFTLMIFNKILFSQIVQQKPLSIGDTLSNIVIKDMINCSNQSINVSDLKGKIVILDFWNVHCKTCILGMPKMDSLQKQFGDKIKIILITQNTEAEVNALFSKVKIKMPNLPIATNDKMFNLLFPHFGDPLHVWINNSGIVSHITSDYNTTAENIQATLNGKRLNFSLRSELENFDGSQPLIGEGATRLKSNVQYYSIILHGLHEVTSQNGVSIYNDSVSNVPTMIHAINVSLLTLYCLAFNNDLFGLDINVLNLPQNNRVILEGKFSKNLKLNRNILTIDEWVNENIYSYELKLQKENAPEIFQLMQQDLNRFFAYDAKIEKRKVKCLALIRVKNDANLKPGSKDEKPFAEQKINGYYVRNMPLSKSLVRDLIYATQNQTMPVIDETHYLPNVDLDIKTKLYSDLSILRKELRKNGLDLVVQEEIIKMLVIREKK
jgi:thiol-disulfide isomerase/thioredoxin